MKKRLLVSAMALVLLLTSCARPAASPTATKVAPEPAATIAPTLEPTEPATPTAMASEEYLDIFEFVWQTVNEKYFDPTFGGLDWNEVRERYRPQIAAAQDHEVFYVTINRMLFELNVSHIGVVPPGEQEQLEPILSAEGSIGMDIRLLDGDAVIMSCRPGSPAAQAGLRAGFVVQRVNGKTVEQWAGEVLPIPPLHERNERKRVTAKLQEQFYGPLDTTVELVYLDAHDEAHETVIQRAERDGKVDLGAEVPPFYVEFESRRLDQDIGYIRFNAFLPPVDQRFSEALESLRGTRGLIIDLRGNHGGVFPVRKGLAEQLVQEQALFWSYIGGTRSRKSTLSRAKTRTAARWSCS